MKTRKLKLILSLVLSLALAPDAQATEQSLDIGVLVCLTGNCSDWGTAALRGVELAASELNKEGGLLGRPVRLLIEDTQESISGARAVSAFRKLTTIDRVEFIIGPSWAPGALAIAPLAARNDQLVLITPSASAEEFSRAGKNIFNMRPSERLASEALADYALSLGIKRGAVLTSSQAAESAQGEIFRDAFSRSGGSIVSYIETNPELSDVRTEVAQIVASKPDVILLMSYNQMDNAAQNLSALGFNGLVLAISLDDTRVAAARGALEGVIVARALSPSADFIRRFKEKFNEAPGLSAENGYDSLVAFAKAITAAGTTDTQQVQKFLKDIQFSGAAGQVAFDESRAVQRSPAFYRVVNGKLEALKVK